MYTVTDAAGGKEKRAAGAVRPASLAAYFDFESRSMARNKRKNATETTIKDAGLSRKLIKDRPCRFLSALAADPGTIVPLFKLWHSPGEKTLALRFWICDNDSPARGLPKRLWTVGEPALVLAS